MQEVPENYVEICGQVTNAFLKPIKSEIDYWIKEGDTDREKMYGIVASILNMLDGNSIRFNGYMTSFVYHFPDPEDDDLVIDQEVPKSGSLLKLFRNHDPDFAKFLKGL